MFEFILPYLENLWQKFDIYFRIRKSISLKPNGLFIPKTSFWKVNVLWILFLYYFTPITLYAQEREHKSILVLYSLGQSFPAVVQWDRGIRSEINSQQDYKITINTEYLDLSRYNDPEYIEKIRDIFDYKYGDALPDLIITVLGPAMDFTLKYRKTLFPEVPIVLAGIEKNSIKNIDLDEKIAGVFQRSNTFNGTLDLALSLHEDTPNAAIIAGDGYLENMWINAARETFQQYEGQLKFTYLQGLSLPELQNEVEDLPDESLIFYFPVLEDKAGRKYVATEVLSSISEVSNGPIYSFWEVLIGHGIVGGYLANFEAQAERTASVALNILLGKLPENTSIQIQNLEYIFDDRQLKRWSIAESKLPAKSEIRFKEYSFGEKYIYRIILISVLVLAQSLIIAYLVVARRRSRRTQEALKIAEQKYRTVADYTYDWEYWQNPDGSIHWVSPSSKRVSGYGRKEIINNPSLIFDMIITDDRKVWEDHQCSEANKIDRDKIKYRIQTPQGEIRWIEHTCQSVFDDQGNNLGIRANNRDITEKELYKSQTNALQSELTHMERVTTISTLSYALAHEINQPLTSIRSYAQAALRFMNKGHSEEENIKKALLGIVADNKRAASIVNQLRDLVKKDAVQLEKVHINSILKDVLRLINSEIIMKNTSIKLNLDPSIPSVNGDAIQLQQVLLNLITNSLDEMEECRTDHRVIAISSRVENSKDCSISIADSGSGIPEDKFEEIFQPFHTTKQKGLGLGLTISKLIIESHNGKIWAENNPGMGAKFVIFLPGNI